jgi:hypothetical protein
MTIMSLKAERTGDMAKKDPNVLAELSDRGQVGRRLKLIAGGKRAYIWAGCDDPYGNFFGAFCGPEKLRAFAEAILAELETSRDGRKKRVSVK